MPFHLRSLADVAVMDQDRQRPYEVATDQPERNSVSLTSLVRVNSAHSYALHRRIRTELAMGNLDCGICRDTINRHSRIWQCADCYVVYHYGCAKIWSNEGAVGGEWRCPGCRSPYQGLPIERCCEWQLWPYRC